MDSYEATRIVFSKIQSLDPENASKIMGYVLIQDHGDKEMIRLALGPEALLHQLIVKAKAHLGLVSSTSPSPANPSSSPFSRVSRPNPLSIPHSASRFAAGNGSYDVVNPSSPAAWPLSGFSDLRSPVSPSTSLSYASVVNGTGNSCSGPGSCLGSSAFPYYGGSGNDSGDLVDEYQLQDRLSFLNDPKGDDFFDYDETHLQHRRSYSVPGGLFGSSDDPISGFGWKPCLYFARGFCKNGSSCRFLHGGDSSDGTPVSGSPEQSQEHLLRSKSFAAQQQKLAATSQFIAGVGAATFPYSKCVNFLLQQENEKQRSAAAALMIGDEMYKFGRCRPERSDFPVMGLGIGGAVTNPGSRQIYLTFPADSTFREEDVSNYFSIYGPVHDVRIPYQQKRMFGFVTFLYPETVKLILAKGNPHFVCDSRVLVKPYKEKGKIPDKKLHHMERGDYLGCSSPTGLDSRDPFDLNLGARMFYNTQEMLLKRKLEEQVDLQQAIELQERRLMNLHLLDSRNHHPDQRVGSPVQSQASSNGNQVGAPSPDGPNEEKTRGCNHEKGDVNGDSNDKAQEEKPNNEDCDDVHQSLEHNLPDNLFSSPKKSDLTASSIHDHESSIASLKSCFLPMPRFSPGRGTIGS